MGDVVKLKLPSPQDRAVSKIYYEWQREGLFPDELCAAAATLQYFLNKAERRITRLEKQIKKLHKPV